MSDGRATSNRVIRYVRVWTGNVVGASSKTIVFVDWKKP